MHDSPEIGFLHVGFALLVIVVRERLFRRIQDQVNEFSGKPLLKQRVRSRRRPIALDTMPGLELLFKNRFKAPAQDVLRLVVLTYRRQVG